MKLALFFLLYSFVSWSRPLVLVGHFDAFGNAPFNNSTRVAETVARDLALRGEIEIVLCPLQTVFDKSFHQLEDCLKALPGTPDLVLGLGESNCNLKIELMARNKDKTKGPDNDGIERDNLQIIPGSPAEIGFTYPLPKMYCALPEKDRKQVEVSNDAGSFVCNNLAYQFTERYPELSFGFIHVPANNCRDLEKKTSFAAGALPLMIKAALDHGPVRLPVRKKELEVLRESTKSDKCLSEFYRRAKGVDEKSFWGIFN